MNSIEQVRLIGRFYNDMWNRFDKSVFVDILHPEIHFRGSPGQTKVGFAEFGDYVDYIRGSLPIFTTKSSPQSPREAQRLPVSRIPVT